jgi:hypothetical protein
VIVCLALIGYGLSILEPEADSIGDVFRSEEVNK